jgi:AGZA family xanthine/uracil permease-like MFS transporter
MLSNIRQIPWQDLGEAIPAFLTLFMIPLTYSIAEGLAIGFISYPVIKACQGKAQEVPKLTWILAGVFILRFLFMAFQFDN